MAIQNKLMAWVLKAELRRVKRDRDDWKTLALALVRVSEKKNEALSKIIQEADSQEYGRESRMAAIAKEALK